MELTRREFVLHPNVFLPYQQQKCSSSDSSLEPTRHVQTKVVDLDASQRTPSFGRNVLEKKYSRTRNETYSKKTVVLHFHIFYKSTYLRTHKRSTTVVLVAVRTVLLAVAPDGDDRGSCVESFLAAAPDNDGCGSSEVIVCRYSSHSSSI